MSYIKSHPWQIGLAIVVAWIVLGALFGPPGPHQPQAGEPCGDGYHYVWIQHGVDGGDLSCEQD